MAPPDKTNFEAWSLDSLIKFAREANERIRVMQEMMDELRSDCRTALNAYREAVKKGSDDTRSED